MHEKMLCTDSKKVTNSDAVFIACFYPHPAQPVPLEPSLAPLERAARGRAKMTDPIVRPTMTAKNKGTLKVIVTNIRA